MNIEIPVSAGELLDKLSILEIKLKNIKDDKKLQNIKKERDFLKKIVDEKLHSYKELNSMKKSLFEVNSILWNVEDDIRIKESKKEFDSEFIDLARKVYYTNDKRFELKNLINSNLGSLIKEEKGYQKY